MQDISKKEQFTIRDHACRVYNTLLTQHLLIFGISIFPCFSLFFLCSTSLDLWAGGMTSHAAVVARGMGRPCVAGAGGITVDYAAAKLTVGSVTVTEGQILTIDGSTGEVMVGEVPTVLWRCKRLEQTWGPTWCTQAAGTTTR